MAGKAIAGDPDVAQRQVVTLSEERPQRGMASPLSRQGRATHLTEIATGIATGRIKTSRELEGRRKIRDRDNLNKISTCGTVRDGRGHYQ